jgi:hypothetical protein
MYRIWAVGGCVDMDSPGEIGVVRKHMMLGTPRVSTSTHSHPENTTQETGFHLPPSRMSRRYPRCSTRTCICGMPECTIPCSRRTRVPRVSLIRSRTLVQS